MCKSNVIEHKNAWITDLSWLCGRVIRCSFDIILSESRGSESLRDALIEPRASTAMSESVWLWSCFGNSSGSNANRSIVSTANRDGLFVAKRCGRRENAISFSMQLVFRNLTSTNSQEALLHIPNASIVVSILERL